MRALVISDTHFGAWTGYDLLREPEYLERLAPQLEGLDEVVMLGDLYDLLFGTVETAFRASEGLLAQVREHLQGKRFVFLAGNHDHHVEARHREEMIQLGLAGEGRGGGGASGGAGANRGGGAGAEGGDGAGGGDLRAEIERRSVFRAFLERRLEGVEVDIRYPAYRFGDVLLTHGHFLDPHARLVGAFGDRLLTQALWRIAAGGREDPRTVEDYEGVITLLTEMLFTIAQLPHGTAAQRNVYRLGQRIGKLARLASLPVELGRRLAAEGAARAGGHGAETGPSSRAGGRGAEPAERVARRHFHRARGAERRRDRRGPMPSDEVWVGYPMSRVLRPSDPQEHSLEAFSKAVANLGWGETGKVVFAHTHQPLSDVRAPGDGGVRYWNTGSWIYEPDLSSHEAYAAYLERGWPGTAVLLDTEAGDPELVECLADLNPLNGGPGIDIPQRRG